MNKDLLARIEKLEQAIQDIWASCSCLSKDIEEEGSEFNCEPPTCEECGEFNCVCEREPEREPEEEVDHE